MLYPVVLGGMSPTLMHPDQCSRLYFFCRLAAERLTNLPPLTEPYYVAHERTGYIFWVSNRLAALRLANFYQHLREGRAYPLAPAYP